VAGCSDGFGDESCGRGSLEDLVSCFDDNVRRCFRNYSHDTQLIAPENSLVPPGEYECATIRRDTQLIAPVQLRTHEQVLHESQCV